MESKYNKYLIIGIVCVIIISLGLLFCFRSINTKEEVIVSEVLGKYDETKLNRDYIFYKFKGESVKLNNKEYPVGIYYYADRNKDNKLVIRREIYINDKLLDKALVVNKALDGAEAIDYINTDYFGNHDYIKDTKLDKDYLVIDVYYMNEFDKKEGISYIVNQEFKVLDTIKSHDNDNLKVLSKCDKDRKYHKVNDKCYLYDNGNYIEYHKDYIYYVIGNKDNLNEYKLTISDNKINKKLVNKYNKKSIIFD